MATIRKSVSIEAPVDQVWSAVRDFGAVHRRLAPGILTDCRLEDARTRIVTFANGMVLKERLVSLEDAERRLVYSAVEGRAEHHNASWQVLGDGGQSRLVWVADVLPDEVAAQIEPLMEHGIAIMKQTLERA